MATPSYSYDDYIQFLEDNEKEKIREIFELFDKNLDGGIDIKELKFILNSLDIFPTHDELSQMMNEADIDNKALSDFMFVIGKQKFEYKNRLKKEASRIIFTIEDAFIALGGDLDLKGTISAKKIQQILTGEFELNEDLEKSLKKISQNKEEISFEEFMTFFQ